MFTISKFRESHKLFSGGTEVEVARPKDEYLRVDWSLSVSSVRAALYKC